ncbi:dihydroorotase [Crocinitomicaceae bacterium CZZ-1]|uniref:Dihydroorotase n=1 Tax=Taishania pollutisoli TaxID=2766479 RepID=A0A8J6TSV4_9FLAO|nr:dihydroorotase [Taishania pollutisoli]MBC9811844.1 dihydroorotase [Taishania pollutisoli]MBX2948216.1 dihydroorotase [Crocinitomicaceae bacterium]
MSNYLLKNAVIVNEGKKQNGDVYIKDGKIERIGFDVTVSEAHELIDLNGAYLLPGCIDDQVHFREPGLTHKATIASESRAAVAGGITSFMEMPNTVPNTLTQELLEEKYQRAAATSIANYSFFMGASNDNIEEVLKTNANTVCGVKVFMGSSTGNMLVDNETTLNNLFSKVPMLIATHCEDEATIRANIEHYRAIYGEDVPVEMHPLIRSEEACYKSSSLAVGLAKKHGARLHILHISTAKELSLFDNSIPLEQKKITAEACVHHLWFSDEDYAAKGNFIKWNPAVKKATDRAAIWQAVLDNRIDVIATDHAPHTIEEKQQSYFKAPSGGPLVQHALTAVLEQSKQGLISIERVVEKMAHAPAILFQIEKRGFIREGYYADLVVVEEKPMTVNKSDLLYQCGWSPFEGTTFSYTVSKTFVNGNLVWNHGKIMEGTNGKRLKFVRG